MFNQEDVLIPFNTSPLPPGPWLVFAPHPDDETFGMGGTILKGKKEGIEMHLVVLTDGAQGGDADNLVEIRRKEVERASEILGFASLQCWSEPDRFLDLKDNLVNRVIDLLVKTQPASVFFPGAFEIHPDHRATASIVWVALQIARLNGTGAKPISYEIGVQNPINLLIDITTQFEEKRIVMQTYFSQNEENNYPELVSALDKARTFSLPNSVKFAEGFYRYKLEDLELTLEKKIHQIVDLYQRKP